LLLYEDICSILFLAALKLSKHEIAIFYFTHF
jgi:hypothetical protein